MNTSAFAKGFRIGVAFANALERKRINGAFFANERYTRSAQYHASPKGHMGNGRGGGGKSSYDAHHARSRTPQTHTNILALTFLHLAGQIPLALFLLRAQPTHPSYVSQSELPHQIGVFRIIPFFLPHTNLDTFEYSNERERTGGLGGA